MNGYCLHCRGETTAGCDVCNPPLTAAKTTYTGPTEPLTDEEIRQFREILREALEKPVEYQGVKIVFSEFTDNDP
jgi:hypothetical protein